MTTSRPLAGTIRRGGWLAGAAVLALTCSACSTLRPAWKHHKRVEAEAVTPSAQGEAPPAAPSAESSPQSAPMAYPWAGGASLPTAAANAPVVRR